MNKLTLDLIAFKNVNLDIRFGSQLLLNIYSYYKMEDHKK